MKIAVVGGGISGLASALILSQRYEVELFESDSRLGGHAHTVELKNENHETMPVDTGFLVYNELTYPHFTQLLKYLKVETTASDMSFSVQTDHGVQWSSTSLSTVFAQKKNLLNLKFLSMIYDLLKFHKQAKENLDLSLQKNWMLDELIKYRHLGPSFVNWYLLPMTGAIWSMSYEKALAFPARSFMQFCMNHHLLQLENRPAWRTVLHGSKTYVNKIHQQLSKVHINHQVQSLKPDSNGRLRLQANNQEHIFDKIVLATSAPISYELLKDGFANLSEPLKDLRTSANRVILHKDTNVMPSIQKCWSSWNVKASSQTQSTRPIELSYYLNKLQPLQTKNPYFITLNPQKEISTSEREFSYHHPQFDAESLRVQQILPKMQGHNGIYFAGAWTRYGFHEDGLLSAVNVSQLLDTKPQWINP